MSAGVVDDVGGTGAVRAPGVTRPRVLIADDNPDLRRYLTRLLADRFAVESVTDGAVALQRARADPPELIIADVMMPGLDGYELLAANPSIAASSPARADSMMTGSNSRWARTRARRRCAARRPVSCAPSGCGWSRRSSSYRRA